MYDFLTYRPVTTDDAKLLLDWRTSPEIASRMLTQVPYDIDRQKAWIERSNVREDYQHRILRIEGRDVGYVSITVTDTANKIGEVGMYVGAANVAPEMSAFNFVSNLNHAFFSMGLHKVVNHVISSNPRVVKAQAFNGFRHVGVLREHVLKDGQRQDLHIFEQSAAEWAVFREKFRDRRDWDGRETHYIDGEGDRL